MNVRAVWWFWSLVALQVVFLLGWAGYHETVRRSAPTVLLKTKPVDPRDLLRGDYILLGYEIADVALPAETAIGADVWVLLEPHGRYYEAVSASRERPALQDRQIAVRAQKGGRGVNFGIEHFYVPEGKGTPAFTTLEVEASVSPTQQLYIKHLLLDGKPYP
ncbi:MAG TPA: GDYXXLXY domain-containing protein [Opitutus sp.]|nr:GDYXXLXY domain-containing protein [Opitutus sp.]